MGESKIVRNYFNWNEMPPIRKIGLVGFLVLLVIWVGMKLATPAMLPLHFETPGPTATPNICLWGCPVHYDGPPANFTNVAPTAVPEEWPSKCYYEPTDIGGTVAFDEGPHDGYSAPVTDSDWGLGSDGQRNIPNKPLIGLCQLFQTTVGTPESVLKFEGSGYEAVVEIPG